MVWLDTSRASDRGLLRGIFHYAQIFGPWLFYHPHPSYLDTSLRSGRSRSLLECLRTWKANGLIANMSNSDMANEITAAGVSLVTIPTGKQGIEGHPNICDDTGATGRLAAEYLLERGFRQFAFCGFGDYWSEVRRQSFSDVVRNHNYEIHIYQPPIRKTQFKWESEISNMTKWLKSLPKPIGLMACNDERGQQLLDACNIASLNVPDEIAILGVDNNDMICETTDPPMSSIVLNFNKCGYEAATILAKLMRGENAAHEKISVEPLMVVSRQSTNLLAIQDRDIADALKYIREHAREKINVNELVKVATVSRHVLYRKFCSAIGRSPHEEILRVRMNEVASMLVTTRLSISKIAYRMGEQDDKHISRCFRQVMGMSPAAYRKKYGIEIS